MRLQHVPMSVGETPRQRQRREQIETFLESQGYPKKPPYDPDRMLWCSLVKMPPEQGFRERPREVISIRPASDPMPPYLTPEDSYPHVSRYPMLVIPMDLDFMAMLDDDSSHENPEKSGS